jgi:predicted GH43/DUF377 family glycosyl hydrolase
LDVKRSDIILKPDIRRVVFRPFEPNDPGRVLKIIARVMELGETEVDGLLKQVRAEFHGRHQKLDRFLLRRFEAVRQHLLTDRELTENRQLLIGAYFSQEYALESAALFNPSLVWHPDQSGLAEGTRRFVMSLRATGEGHISSLCFRSGTIDLRGQVSIDKPTGYVTAPEVVPNSEYEKALFLRKLVELGLTNGFIELVLGPLEDTFTIAQLEESVRFVLRQHRVRRQEWEPLAKGIVALAKANYEIECEPQSHVSERVIFPYSPTEISGIEDARFVELIDDGESRYCATYTAFDGSVILPQMVETRDFVRFRISTLNGPEVKNKGMALFPRKINGQYAMLSRQDGENLYLMYSDMLHFWYTRQLLLKPTYPWEFVQIGNCGSPIETEAGWLVLSHGVGPMRKYSIGALLLDRDDPSQVIGRLAEPILAPNENEREGYVPNVVYSCGGLVHGEHLIIPYAMSDYATTFSIVELKPLLERLCA